MNAKPHAILMIEDNPGDVRFIREQLADAAPGRFELRDVPTLTGAMERLTRERPDVILLDLSLPDAVGVDMIGQVRRAAAGVPVIVLTGLTDESAAIQAVGSGAHDFLRKDEINGRGLVRCILYAIERARAQEAEQARRNLEQSVHAMEQMMGVVGHELRTPLAALRMTTEFLLGQGVTDGLEPFIRSIHGEAIRLAEMVNNMLETARLNSGLAKWNWTSVPVARTCADALKIIGPLVDPGKIELMANVEPADLSMRGDADAVLRLLINLLSNAAKNTERGTIAIEARAIRQDDQRYVKLQVRDTGMGIAPEMAGKLGKAFACNSGAVGWEYAKGFGLGLAICRTIVAVHGGSLTISSRVNHGSTFTLLMRADLTGPAMLPAEIQKTENTAA